MAEEKTDYDNLGRAEGGDNGGKKKKIIIGVGIGVVILAVILIIVFTVGGGHNTPDGPEPWKF